ncbi:MAG: cytochrome c oxidase subunit II [Thermoguttaceae bacterium]|jgi:cytochrome c oxidase subunit 2
MIQLAPLLAEKSFWLEPAASTSARQHDTVFYTLLYVTGFFFCLVVALMLTFIVLYRRRKSQPQLSFPTHNTLLEIAWTAVPLIVVLYFFVVGLRAFLDFDTPPTNAEVVDVDAKQWSFSFTYPNGAVSDALYLRVDQPVRLALHSDNVLHSLYIPAFRAQRNAVPGRTVDMWFQPTEIGTYHAFCTQYCGDGHSRMNAEVEVMDDAHYSAKLTELANIFVDPATKKRLPNAVVGEKLYRTSGCAQCHTVDGAPSTGPTWLGLYKRDHEFSVPPGGYTLLAGDDDAKWDAYLRESVLDPGAKIVKGYQNVMPSYASQFSGPASKEKKLTAIVEYIKSLDNHGPGGRPKYYRPLPPPKAEPAGPPSSEKQHKS